MYKDFTRILKNVQRWRKSISYMTEIFLESYNAPVICIQDWEVDYEKKQNQLMGKNGLMFSMDF